MYDIDVCRGFMMGLDSEYVNHYGCFCVMILDLLIIALNVFELYTALNLCPMYYTLCLFSMATRGSNQGTSVHSPAQRLTSIISGRLPDSAEYPTFHTTVLAALCPRLYMSGLQQKSHTVIL
ncbi:hypothetical protein BDB01DRAFT_837073 [Pilobolus umbonatus]|nr:hypothetical protein BDB01DRAFT_837073 [Pilobolus umbonatus]